MEADPADRPSAKDVVEMLSQQVEKPVAGSRRSSRKQVCSKVNEHLCTSPTKSNLLRVRASHRGRCLGRPVHKSTEVLRSCFGSTLFA
jgi:hypothetical protein